MGDSLYLCSEFLEHGRCQCIHDGAVFLRILEESGIGFRTFHISGLRRIVKNTGEDIIRKHLRAIILSSLLQLLILPELFVESGDHYSIPFGKIPQILLNKTTSLCQKCTN